MKAITRSRYGTAEVLTVSESDTPTPAPNEVLIRVMATTVNRTDCAILTGKPWVMRLFTGLTKPRFSIPGTDFAGTVVSAGKDVDAFNPGDRVMGFDDMGLESHAHFMTLAINKPIAKIPASLSFEQAAASLEGAHYAVNFVNKVAIHGGQKVLVNGATGAIGSVIVQIAKYYEAEVTAVCPGEFVELVRSLGADQVIDYTREDFTHLSDKFDFIFDAVGKSTFGKCKHLLKDGGVYISSELGPWIQNPILALFTPLFGKKKVIFPVPSNIEGSMAMIIRMVNEGKFQPVIDRTYPMDQIAKAYEYVFLGKKIGNVIISMEN